MVKRATTLAAATAATLLMHATVIAQADRAAAKRAAEARERARITATIRGRCVDGETGMPLAGCKVEAQAWGRSRDGIPKELLQPAPVTTGADGRFTLRVLAREAFQVRLDLERDGRWPRTGRWKHLLSGETADVGDVALHPGVHAVGKVVNQQGEPMPKVNVGIDGLPLYIGVEADRGDTRAREERLRERAMSDKRELHLHANKIRYASTGADGTFASRDALPPGTFEVRLSARGVSLADPTQRITIPAEGPMQPVTIVVKEQPCIAGIVRDEKGVPVPGVSLQAELRRSGRMASGRTGEDGRFRIYRVLNSPEKVRIRVFDPGPCETAPPTDEYPWGKKDVVIVLRRALAMPIEVVEAGSGKPVPEFAIRCYPVDGGTNSLRMRLRQSGRHAGGKLDVTNVHRGAGWLTVVPEDPQLLPLGMPIHASAGMAVQRVEVTRLVPMKLLVLDAKGQLRAGVMVQVVTPGNTRAPLGREIVNQPRRDDMGAFSSDPTTTFDTEIYRATTDGLGQCIVYGIAGRDDLILRLSHGKGTESTRVTDVAFGPQHLSRKLLFGR